MGGPARLSSVVNREVSPSEGVPGQCEVALWERVQLVHSQMFH